MIPNNALTTIPDPARFKNPYDLPESPTSRACRGGIGLNNAAKGRNYQNWYVWYEAGVIYFGPVAVPLEAMGSLTVPGVKQLSLAFDNNMNPIICWLDATGANLRYFSAGTSSYVVLSVAGATSCLVTVDDSRNFYNASSDAVFAYTASTGLWYTYQRENYAIPRKASNSTNKLTRMGLNAQNRFQFETTPVP